MKKPLIITKNKYGVSIVKCCASCKFKKCDNRTRLCMAGEGSVPSNYLCRQWEMAEGLDNAGSGQGQVKSKSYLTYSLDSLNEEDRRTIIAANSKTVYVRKSANDIREEFKKKNGDIFVNM